MEIKRFAYAFVGLWPSERQEIARLLAMACVDRAQLRLAASGEHPDFWVINGDEPEAVARLQEDPVLAVGGEVDCLARVERPFELAQAQTVMTRLLGALPDTGRAGPARAQRDDVFDLSYAASDAWGKHSSEFATHDSHLLHADRSADDGSEFSSEYASRMELSPSELAMTEDDPSDLLRLRLRRAEYEERVSHTLEPSGVSEAVTHEWLDVMPAQVLVIAELGERTRTLPRGLRRMGFGVDVIDGPEHALNSLAGKEYRVIFMEQQATAGETVRCCRALVSRCEALGMTSCVVVVARRKSTIERWRAMRAGCAAWMLVPLDRRRLLGFLTERGIERSLPREA